MNKLPKLLLTLKLYFFLTCVNALNRTDTMVVYFSYTNQTNRLYADMLKQYLPAMNIKVCGNLEEFHAIIPKDQYEDRLKGLRN